MDELNILVSHCPNLHILAFTETCLDNSISDSEVSLPGYSIFRSDRTNGRGGGIAVYVAAMGLRSRARGALLYAIKQKKEVSGNVLANIVLVVRLKA